jgi:hypothetical protein
MVFLGCVIYFSKIMSHIFDPHNAYVQLIGGKGSHEVQ